MKLVLGLSALLLVISCAHHRDVRPGADGLHKVVIQTDDEMAGARYALEQADHYCGGTNLRAAIVEEEKNYTGTMNEADYKTAKKASKAAQVIGGLTYGMGNQTNSSIGSVVGLGGVAADTALGAEYNVVMKFKCM